VFIAMIGFQKKISNSFLKAFFHAFLLNICMIPASSIILLAFHSGSISDILFYLQVSIPIFVIFLESSLPASIIVISSWLLFLLLLGLSLWAVRKTKKKMIRIWGQILIILVFAGAYFLCHNLIVEAVGAAIAATAFPPP
jgi:hypothetical protein